MDKITIELTTKQLSAMFHEAKRRIDRLEDYLTTEDDPSWIKIWEDEKTTLTEVRHILWEAMS